MLDRWQEILDTLWRHKVRTLLTALSVAWGIFMLVILLGAGSGIENQVWRSFGDDALTAVWVRPGKTSKPFAGYQVGRKITLDNEDYDALVRTTKDISQVSGRLYIRDDTTVRFGDKYAAFNIRAVHPGHLYLEKTIITQGRFVNQRDVERSRKTAVLGTKVVEHLYGNASPIGTSVDIAGTKYLVVGVFDDEGGEREQRTIYIPITTAQTAYGAGTHIDHIVFSLGDDATAEQTLNARDHARALLNQRKSIAPSDKQAVRVRAPIERYQRLRELFGGVQVFIWIIGIGTTIAGMIGVSNIMMISVRERTKEFGLRKALGATPRSIVTSVVQEALLLTATSGYLGLVLGVASLELISRNIPDNDFIHNPQVDLGAALIATALLILAGTLAGYFPARSASAVNPVVALRDE